MSDSRGIQIWKQGLSNEFRKLHFGGYVEICTLLKSVILKFRKQVLFWQKVMSGEWESDIFVRNRTWWWFFPQKVSICSRTIFLLAPLQSQIHFCAMSLITELCNVDNGHKWSKWAYWGIDLWVVISSMGPNLRRLLSLPIRKLSRWGSLFRPSTSLFLFFFF